MSVKLHRKASDVCDGVLLSQAGDPPGQRSVYIPPGDSKQEGYRLFTFKDFPRYSSVNIHVLAAKGFYYTGYKDRIKCFSCGQIVEDLKSGDDSMLSRFHKQDCDFKSGHDSTNIPLNGYFHDNRELSQNETRRTSPFKMNSISNCNDRLSAGEVLMLRIPKKPLGFSTTNPSSTNQTPTSSRESTSPPASVVAATKATEKPHLGSTAALSKTNKELFPCRYPINPHMKSDLCRMQTFLDNSAAWSTHRISATSQEISEAGFFYLGERDKVKCWYCSGNLQNWELGDIPWQEHAKWFPMCEFLLQQKGIDYVRDVASTYPNLRRPTLRNPTSAVSLRSLLSSLPYQNRDVPPPRPFVEHVETPIVVIDPRQKQREVLEKIEIEMKSSDIVSRARMMAFDEEDIKSALKSQYEMNGEFFTSLEPLVDALLANEEGSAEVTENEDQALNSEDRQVSNEKLATGSGEQAIRELEESRRCKNCHKKPACMVFVPCGHLACCLDCGRAMQKCVICHSVITERIRSYIA